MNGLKMVAAVAVLAGVVGCETMSTGQLMQTGLEAAIRNYAGQDVSPRAPRDAYRRTGNYDYQRAQDRRYVRESTGYQRLGPYTDARGQRYVVVREYFSDGSYQDSPQLF